MRKLSLPAGADDLQLICSASYLLRPKVANIQRCDVRVDDVSNRMTERTEGLGYGEARMPARSPRPCKLWSGGYGASLECLQESTRSPVSIIASVSSAMSEVQMVFKRGNR
jgi:hypothetical protein